MSRKPKSRAGLANLRAAAGSSNGRPSVSELPRWDADLGELHFGGRVVKRLRIPAPNVRRILGAFQEHGWRRRINDPLEPTPGVEPKQRLHNALNALNRALAGSGLRFGGDGTGTGIIWHIPPQPDRTHLAPRSSPDLNQTDT
jgi:hypothetical protein